MTRSDTKFKATMYVDAYILACQGMGYRDIAKTFGISLCNFEKWVKKRPAFKLALEKGNKRKEEVKSGKGDANSFKNYVYRQLPPKLRALWEQLRDLSIKKRFKKRKYLLDMETDEVKKHMFIYALCARNFNPSHACKSVCISWGEFQGWLKEPDFKELLDQIEIHRNNFYEEALVKKVKEGDTGAILFVNRTKNRDRGYGDKTTIEMNGKIEHQHSHLIKIDDLPLTLEVKKAILAAIREKEGNKKLVGSDGTLALEYKKVNGVAVPIETEEE